MSRKAIAASGTPRKVPAAIAGFDEFTSSGLLRGPTTLLCRWPGILVQIGERKRGIWNRKWRDTAHSYQVRKPMLCDSVVSLDELQRRDISKVSHPCAMSQRDAVFVFRLYVAGQTQNSTQAVANLTAICREHLPGRHTIEIVDIFQQP